MAKVLSAKRNTIKDGDLVLSSNQKRPAKEDDKEVPPAFGEEPKSKKAKKNAK